jgi:transposase-like protein
VEAGVSPAGLQRRLGYRSGMTKNERMPKTLTEAIRYFSDEDRCVAYIAARRWPDGEVKCPICGSGAVKYLGAKYRRWKCSQDHERRQFSVKVGTIFEDSPLSLTKWLPAVWLVTNCKNGVSSLEIHRSIKVTQKTAWFMLHRIRLAMQRGTFDRPMGEDGGDVEADETFIGGLARNMHRDRRGEAITGTGGAGKAVVMGLLDRKTGRVRVAHVANRKRETVQGFVKRNVEAGAAVHTDEWVAYEGLAEEYMHNVINHAEAYVRGTVHTNGMENFWSLLKRGLKGTYVSVEPFHLFRYIDEQAFRFNERKNEEGDGGRFNDVLSTIAGRRLTYKQLTGKTAEAPTAATV